ncbi:hypothetical protein SPRG_12367 [Saprolegnia parasitica CBS 223.65]|uniref:Uncharacterized protein n=1 Tax=Saprolegnia parasitica (strain CBS 223.65) TaxID=695850 RepID=A0A067BYD8_SAPPC|nr:hypothetical protein SPRG_12367 [Saprolegnia parasitica CBS 223.65]KDO21865.1 hypothetical protein SPRG_12367 [Saprolegnia parasitica CBS 223.65]|eukprot:XP_012207421.1 hypothetical protein SPRG_12367 [Saprolegnia parasitica CBS 223.65]
MQPCSAADLHAFLASSNPDRPLLCPEPISLGNNLVLRRATPADQHALVTFNGTAHGHMTKFGGWTKDRFQAQDGSGILPPKAGPESFTIIVDTSKNDLIVSSCQSIPQVWCYGIPNKRDASSSLHVPLTVVRPEAIGTLEAYRGRGLIAEHFKVHHAWAAALSSELQFIGGIPSYYTRFGYELCPRRGVSYTGHVATIPPLRTEAEPVRFRKATAADVPFLDRVARAASLAREGIYSDADAAQWRFLVSELWTGSYGTRPFYIIETNDNASHPIGFVRLNLHKTVTRFELDEASNVPRKLSWADVTPSLLRWLPHNYLNNCVPFEHLVETLEAQATGGDAIAPLTQELPSNWSFTLELGGCHPGLRAVPSSYVPIQTPSGHWYTRIPSWTAFLRAIAPVLEHRLASDAAFYAVSRTIVLHKAYRVVGGGTRLRIECGRVSAIDDIPRGVSENDLVRAEPDADRVLLPGTVACSLFLGHRTLSELLHQQHQVHVSAPHVPTLVDVLFPRMANDEIHGLQ